MFIDTQSRPAGEVQQRVGRLRLSEAIRIGARIRPQCSGRWFEDGKSCAIGAAMEGAGWREEVEKYERENEGTSPWLMVEELFKVPFDIVDQIWRRNDLRGESRESIADWLQSQGL